MSDQLIYNILIYRYGVRIHMLWNRWPLIHPPDIFYFILFYFLSKKRVDCPSAQNTKSQNWVLFRSHYIILYVQSAMWSARFRQSCESNPHLELSQSFFFLLFCGTSLVINWQTLTLNSSKWVEAMSERGTWAGFRYPVLKEMPLR